MKKIVLGIVAGGLVLGFSASVQAAASAAVASVSAGSAYTLCDGNAGGGKTTVWGGSGTVIPAGTTTVFTRSGFDVQCSSNVFLKANEVDANLAVVGAGSAKGNQTFVGTSNGGAVGPAAKCTGTNDSCVEGDIDSAIAAAAGS